MCCQADKAWVDAIYAYGRSAQIRVSAAIAPCAAGECYLACGNRPLAAKAFRAALLVCGTERDGEEHEGEEYGGMGQAEIRQRARAGLVKAEGEHPARFQRQILRAVEILSLSIIKNSLGFSLGFKTTFPPVCPVIASVTRSNSCFNSDVSVFTLSTIGLLELLFDAPIIGRTLPSVTLIYRCEIASY